jgi:hypothetical protein
MVARVATATLSRPTTMRRRQYASIQALVPDHGGQPTMRIGHRPRSLFKARDRRSMDVAAMIRITGRRPLVTPIAQAEAAMAEVQPADMQVIRGQIRGPTERQHPVVKR